MLHPGEETRVPYVTTALDGAPGPVVAVSDWMRAVPDQISRWVPATLYTSLGTDGFGFSDTAAAARRFFHVDAESIVLAVLSQLARSGQVDASLPARRSRGTGSTCRCRRPSASGVRRHETRVARRAFRRATRIVVRAPVDGPHYGAHYGPHDGPGDGSAT